MIPLRQQLSHASLLQDVLAPSPIRGRIDAIVTPARGGRPTCAVRDQSVGDAVVPLVVLCSSQAQPHQVECRVGRAEPSGI